jgi:hypothetical protein
MSNSVDWFPGKRAEQLAMARNWLEVLSLKATLWGVPAAESTALTSLTGEAETSLVMAMSNDLTPVVTAHCKAAFDALEVKMRYIKTYYFLKPHLAGEARGDAVGFKAA